MPTYSCEVIHSLWITFFEKPLDKRLFMWYIITMNARIRDGPLLGVVKRELTPPSDAVTVG